MNIMQFIMHSYNGNDLMSLSRSSKARNYQDFITHYFMCFFSAVDFFFNDNQTWKSFVYEIWKMEKAKS